MDINIRECVIVVNKESIRKYKSLYHKILQKKANSRLIYEMMKNDPDYNTTKYVYRKGNSNSNAFKVASYVKSLRKQNSF